MKSKTRSMMFLMTVLTVLAISAFWTLPALADDEVPPPVPTSEPVQPPEEVPPPLDATPAADQPVIDVPATEIPVMEEVPPTEVSVVEETAPVGETVAELLAQVPEGTELVVVNGEGETVPLVTQEAATIINTNDPIWCPTGVAPNPGVGGCTTTQDTFNGGLLTLLSGKTVNGTIWILGSYQGTVSTLGTAIEGGGIVLDGGALGTTANYALTVKGGWTGTSAGTINTLDPSEFNVSFSIINWLGDINLSNILITGVVAGPALNVDTSKNITLTNVNVNANSGSGAKLDNTDLGSGTGNVTVTSSKFTNNSGGTGLDVDSRGTITLTNVIANNNGDHGAYLYNAGASSAKAVSVTNSVFNSNAQVNYTTLEIPPDPPSVWQMGLQVFSKGAITLKDIDAIGNGNTDLDGDDGGVHLDNTAGTASVILLGTNIVSENEWGLGIYSHGAITVNNLVAVSQCCGSGAYIDNATGTLTAQPVTFTGFVQANYNGRGLHIFSNGAVTISNVTAMNNHGTNPEAGGVFIKNDFGFVSNVTLLGTNSFIDNAQRGLYILTQGIITLNNISANGNGHGVASSDGWGAYLDNSGGGAKAVIVKGTNSFGWNYFGGLSILSKGAITLNNINASGNNNDNGALLINDIGLPQNVTITGNTIVNNNFISGLVVNTKGAIILGNVNANDNGDTGVYLVNNTGTTPKSVTLSGTINDFHNNGGSGLKIESLGAITLNNTQTSNNTLYGLYLNNNFALALGGITLKGNNGFNNNGDSGLEAYSKGNILLNNIDSSNNGTTQVAGDGYGAYLQNNYPGASGTVTITGYGTFNNNYSGGLVIYSKGAITISAVDASGNINGNGAILKNDYPGVVSGITISGWGGNFSDNVGYGLNATSFGAIKASGLWAWGNTLYGATLDNSAGTGAVIITGDTGYGYNDSDGLIIHSKGAITLGTIYTDTNGGVGVILDNRYSGTLAPQNVTLNGAYHDFNWNVGDGLQVYSYGMITITNLHANDNGGFGALLDNCLQSVPGTCTTTTAKPITLNGNNDFVWNGANGLDITSKGVITINNVIASDNDGFGAFLDNQMTGAVGVISVKNTPTYSPEFARNGFDGLKIHSNGSITVMDLDAFENGQAGNPAWGYGVYLDNASGGGTGSISLGTSRANWANGLNNNFLSGLEIYTNGAVTLNNLRANDNGHYNSGTDTYYGYGAYVDNSGATPQNVTIKGNNNFQSNWRSGLEVYSYGIITINNVSAQWNGRFDDPLYGGVDTDGPDTVYGNGVYLDNCIETLGVCGATAPKPVFVNGSNNFEGNWVSGLEIHSSGAVTVSNINANNNGWGMYIVNKFNALAPQNVTVLGANNNFNGSWATGLEVYSYGIIALNNVTANWNGWGLDQNAVIAGAVLDNCDWNGSSCAAAPKSIILNGKNFFEGNQNGGLNISSSGAVIMNNLTANNNGHYDELGDWGTADTYYGYGVDIEAHNASQAVTLTGTNTFNGNVHNGLEINSKGAISLSNITAMWNGWFNDVAWGGTDTDGPDTVSGTGVVLNNSLASAGVNITITGINTFNGNWDDGLSFDTNGSLSVTKLTANNNGNNGVEGYAANSITITCGNMHGNGWNGSGSGYNLSATLITLKGVFGFGNNSFNLTSVPPVVTRACPLP